MSTLTYDAAPVAIRDDLIAAHRRAWRRIAEPGTWLDGPRRVAVAQETRAAPGCALCRRRKEALSPYTVEGAHDSLGELPETMVEAVHRIVTDSARLSKRWYQGLLEQGLGDAEYVEIVGVVCTTVTVDTFARGIGMDRQPLPHPVGGAPSRQRPKGAKQGPAWVPWIAPEDATGAEADLYPANASHIQRALTLVPAEKRGFFDLVETQYLPGHQMRDFANEFRAITHSQIELLAARVSVLNQCVY